MKWAKETEEKLILLYADTPNYELIKILPTINNIVTNKISTDDIDNIEVVNVYLEVYNKEELYSIAKTFNSKKEFRNENLSVYNKLYRMGLLNDATKHLSKKNS